MITKWEGKVILAVEDDEISLEFLKELFEPYKVSLLYAYNGQTAIDICRSNSSVELILMDVQLPVLNGKTAMLEIKKFRPDLPIIAQTAFAMSGDKERYIQEGFDDYVSKPINVQELLLLVKKYLE
jgi:two-component system cell cycle response regulator DivK